MAFAPDPSVHRQSVDGIQPITVLWQSPCYDVSRHGTVVIPEQPRVDDGTCRGRGDKVVMVSLLTWLSLTSCLLSCNGVTRAARRGNEKIWILGGKNKNCRFVFAAGTRSAFSTFLIIVPDFWWGRSALYLLPVPVRKLSEIGKELTARLSESTYIFL